MDSVLNCTGHALKLADIVGGDGAWLVDGKGKRWEFGGLAYGFASNALITWLRSISTVLDW